MLLPGKYDLVNYMLSMLHKFVKMMNEAERPVNEVPSALWKWFSDQQSDTTSNTNYDALFSGGEDTTRHV
jgi:hypothetical protein